MTTVLVPLAQECEELEAVTIIDLLRRAEIKVISASLDDKPITASRGVVLIADMSLNEAAKESIDMIVLPGGLPGANYLNDDNRIHDLIKKTKYVAAICASPKVLANARLLDNKQATAYPGVLSNQDHPKVLIQDIAVAVDGNIITSRGPGTAIDFTLKLIEILTDEATKTRVEDSLKR